jgi:uncharacterized protein YcsI (UPF0317 family)
MRAVDGKASRGSAPATCLEVLMACRSGGLAGHTTRLARGFVRGNLAILPRDRGEAFPLYWRSSHLG